MRQRMGWRCLIWCGVCLATTAIHAEESLTKVVPAGAIVSAEITDAAATISRLKTSEALRQATSSPVYRTWANSSNGRKFRGGRALLEGQLGMNLWDAAERLIGQQVLVAVYPPSAGNQPDGVLVIRFETMETAALIREKLSPWIEISDGAIQADERDGSWLVQSADNKAFGALREQWLVISNRESLRTAVLDRVSKTVTESLADSPAWKHQTALANTTSESRLQVIWDSAPVRPLLGAESEARLLPAKLDNPLASLLLGGLIEVAAKAPEMQGALTIHESGFVASVLAPVGKAEIDPAHQTLLATAPSTSDLITPVPRQLASIVLCRDWADWYRQREALLESPVLPEFDKFETGLSNLLPGKDFCEDVLTLLNAPITLVAAEQTYPHLDGRPGMQLPAFAVVVDLTNADRGADLFQLFFQTLGTIVNIEAGKSGRQPWVMHSAAYQDIPITYAKYLDRPQGEDLPVVFNFQPASALVGQKYVAATSLELCHDLIDVLQRPASGGNEPTTKNFAMTVDPVVAMRLLQANKALLAARSIQEGKTSEQADNELSILFEALQALQPLLLTTDVTGQHVELRLQGGWK
ncbi:hypothetical protein GC163_22640 [bacterium]|nr:hypothetical protein [bacterium]